MWELKNKVKEMDFYTWNKKEIAETSWMHNKEEGLEKLTSTRHIEGNRDRERHHGTHLTSLCDWMAK